MSEILTSPELTDEQFAGLVSGVANHEAKALTLAAMASERGEDGFFTSAALDSKLRAIQGGKPGWNVSINTPYSYCDESMGPIGAVAKSTIITDGGRTAGAYALTPFGQEFGLAMAGMVLDWSLKYPDISVQTVLGSSQSKTSNRTPVYRLAILESVLTAGQIGTSFAEIAADHPDLEGLNKVVENLKRGAFSKVVEVTTNQKEYNPIVTIVEPEYRGKKGLDKLSEERQAIYRTMRVLAEDGMRDINLNGFVDKIVDLHPDISATKVRNIITQTTNRTQTGLPGLKMLAEGRAGLGEKKSSTVRVNEEHEEALNELVSNLYDFKTTDKINFYRERALEIVEDPELCAEVMSKAAHNSMKVRSAKLAQPIGQIIFGTLQVAVTPLSAFDISEKLKVDHELPISIDDIRNHLMKAIKEGKIIGERQTYEQSGRSRTLMYYQVAPDSLSSSTALR